MASKVMIIGGGASGLMTAIVAARRHLDVTVLEHKEKPGKKILATGNGKCNYTNYVQDASCYRSSDSEFAMKVYEHFKVEDTIEFFKTLGIYPKVRNGYVYPNSGQATSVLEVLLMECRRLCVKIQCNEHVIHIEKKKKGFEVRTKENRYFSDDVVIATGGCAAMKLGSDGSGYPLAKTLGHTIVKPLPALVQLKSNAKYLKAVSGVRTEAAIKVVVAGETVVCEKGEILFANYGISGIPVMQVSRFAADALENGNNVELKIDFLPDIFYHDVLEEVCARIANDSTRTAKEIMIGLLNDKLVTMLLKEAGINPEMILNQGKKHQLKQFVDRVKNFRMKIVDTNGFENAQTCMGGVNVSEINPDTMESKKVKGLYFTGEIVDVDGTCGGYNLQWAWSTGVVAGRSL